MTQSTQNGCRTRASVHNFLPPRISQRHYSTFTTIMNDGHHHHPHYLTILRAAKGNAQLLETPISMSPASVSSPGAAARKEPQRNNCVPSAPKIQKSPLKVTTFRKPSDFQTPGPASYNTEHMYQIGRMPNHFFLSDSKRFPTHQSSSQCLKTQIKPCESNGACGTKERREEVSEKRSHFQFSTQQSKTSHHKPENFFRQLNLTEEAKLRWPLPNALNKL